jgi:ParB-like chromosome segregation protein Spo0J
MLNAIRSALAALNTFELAEKIQVINEIKIELHKHSPFKAEPVDCIIWIPQSDVVSNNYNPNSVAPPEMKLLEQSILQDGYTQPIVSWDRDGQYEVVDGFHRNRVGKESAEVKARIHGYLPLTVINQDRRDLGDRMVSTIRHNRARGKHSVDSMSDIVVELKKRNRSDSWISKNLGMEVDEILRLCQISGLTEMFKDDSFSASWEADVLDNCGEEILLEGGSNEEDLSSVG